MRRWIVERKPVPLPPERITSLLVHRMRWERTTLPEGPEGWLDLKVRVEPGPGLTAWLVVVGTYPVCTAITAPAPDVQPLRLAAQSRARDILDELAGEVLTVLAPLPGIEPFATGTPDALRVRHVMATDALVLDEDLAPADAAALLFAEDTDSAPVVDARGRLIGVLSERDLLGHLVRDLDPTLAHPCATIGTLCTRPAIVTVPGLPAVHAAQQMLFHGVRRLIVVDEGRLVGTVTRQSLFAALRATAPSAAPDPASQEQTLNPDAPRVTHQTAPA